MKAHTMCLWGQSLTDGDNCKNKGPEEGACLSVQLQGGQFGWNTLEPDNAGPHWS